MALSVSDTPGLQLETLDSGVLVRASGVWIVQHLAASDLIDRITTQIAHLRADSDSGNVQWDLTAISRLDHLGAQFFWNFWGKQLPRNIKLGAGQDSFFERLANLAGLEQPQSAKLRFAWLYALGEAFSGLSIMWSALSGCLASWFWIAGD